MKNSTAKYLEIVQNEIGVCEGPNNFNKYAEMPEISDLLGWNVQNQPWCCIFLIWCLARALGMSGAMQAAFLHRRCGAAACANWAALYQQNGAWIPRTVSPAPGDQAFFYSGDGINHTGAVVSVASGKIETVEGNYSDAVKRVWHFIDEPSLAGFGRPRWPDDGDVPEMNTENTSMAQRCETPVQIMTGPTPLLTIALKDEVREDVKAFQILHNYRFDSQIPVSGKYDSLTADACGFVQEAYGIENDKECGRDTWFALITGGKKK